jgi:hypothetical protein
MKKIAVIFFLIAFGCKKKTEVANIDFAPLTAGSNWTYVQTQGSTNTTFKITATDRDSTIGTRKYRVLNNSIGSNVYSTKEGSNYYRAGFLTLANVGVFEELYLKDGAAVSTNWTQQINITVSSITAQINLSFTVQEVGATKTVLGKTYTDVVRVRLDANVPLLSANIGGGDFYYAKGVGLINYALNITAVASFPAVNQSVNLQAYEIK